MVKDLPASAGDPGSGRPLQEEMTIHPPTLPAESHGPRSLLGYMKSVESQSQIQVSTHKS